MASDVEIVTLEELEAWTETTVRLPLASQAAGRDIVVLITRVARPDYLAMLPPAPPGSWEWPEKEFRDRERAWLETLAPEALAARAAAMCEVKYRLCAMAMRRPTVTLEQARRLGDDALTVAAAILRFSGFLDPAAASSATPEENKETGSAPPAEELAARAGADAAADAA